MFIDIRPTAFDPWKTLAEYQDSSFPLAGKFGATATFVGTMRDFNEGDNVKKMTLEYYPGMTEKQLTRIVEDKMATHDVLDVLVVHRVGDICPGDPIVLVAVWSAHRAAAFTVCREIMEALKSTAPFWKNEVLENGNRWVKNNSAG